MALDRLLDGLTCSSVFMF